MRNDVPLGGHTTDRFAPVRDAFADVVGSSPGTGSALAVWHGGEWVVDLWGGYADAARTRPWERDTLVMPYSVTKPFAAVCVLLLADRQDVDLDDPVARYWPELPGGATVRQLLDHSSGHVVLDEPAPEEAFYDWDLMRSRLEAQPPSWEPGTAVGESALFYGHLLGELVRRVDGRSLGRFLREEVTGPLGLDFHVGVPEGDLPRVADLTGFDAAFRAGIDESRSLLRPALTNPPGALDPGVVNGERWRRAEVPAVNGHGTARAVAGFYAAVVEGAVLAPELSARMVRASASGRDRVIDRDAAWGLGVAVEPDGWGMGGLGGSFGWWSEDGQYAVGFLTAHVADHDRGDRLEGAVRDCLGLPPV